MYQSKGCKCLYSILILMIIVGLVVPNIAATKRMKQPRKIRLEQATVQKIILGQDAKTDSTCIARNDQGIAWLINQWVIGQEVYSVLIDPSDSCPGGPPYSVNSIGMILYFGKITQLTISANVRVVDSSDIFCTVPGILTDLSTSSTFNIPDTGLWDIQVPFDIPATVNGPFFAEFFIENIVDSSDAVGLITDDNPVPCVTYNEWDPSIGYIDLVNNEYFNFPGRLVMYASVTPSDGSCCQLVGDMDHSGSVNITDLTFIVDFIFRDGASPICPEEWDVNGSSEIDISDLTNLIEFIFYQGSPPVNCSL